MKLQNQLKAALRSLSKNKMRTFLTMLGIIIGVASVIAMLAIGQESKESIQAQILKSGNQPADRFSFCQYDRRCKAGSRHFD